MGRDGAEGASAETAAMDVDRELDHLVGGDALALILGVGQSRVWQVERGVKFLGGHRRVGGIDDDDPFAHLLQQTLGMHHVRLFLDVAEVLGLCPLVAQTLLMGVQHDVVAHDAARNIFLSCEEYRLRQVFQILFCSLLQITARSNVITIA